MKPPSRRFDLAQSLNLFSIASLGVVLVLLLIFFAATPSHREWGPNRPFSRTAAPIVGAETDLHVYVLRDGRLVLGRQTISEEALTLALREQSGLMPGRQLVLEADRAAPYSRVEAVFRAARDAGFRDVRVLTGPRDPLEAMTQSSARP